MKKLLLSIIAISFISSCEKKTTTTEPTEIAENTDSIQVIEEPAIVYQPTFNQTEPLQKINLTDLSNIVGNHENDTIYVTNFFATWCGPCMREIPHFQEKMEELKNQPVKFIYVNLDDPSEWDSAVKGFADKSQLGNHIVLVKGEELTPHFFSDHFKKWDGSFIPFTLIKKGAESEEIQGSTSKEVLSEKIKSLMN